MFFVGATSSGMGGGDRFVHGTELFLVVDRNCRSFLVSVVVGGGCCGL